MGFQIQQPYYLVLIPIVFSILYWTNRKSQPLNVTKKKFVYIRGIILGLLILALSGLSFYWSSKETVTVFVVDLSHSAIDYRNDASMLIRDAIQEMPKNNLAGIVTFGNDTLIEQFVTDKKLFQEFSTAPIQSATNIESAMTVAISMMKEDAGKRIVLISDGEENEGSMTNMIASLNMQEIGVKVLQIENKVSNEVYVKSLTLPKKVSATDSFSVNVDITSNVFTKAKLSLFSGRTKKGEIEVELQKGDNKFVFKDHQVEPGLKTYKVLIEPEEDTEIRNNQYVAFTQVETKPNVLVIEKVQGDGKGFAKLLENINIPYKIVLAEGAPDNITEMNEYKSIITINVHKNDFSKGFLEHIETYVKDFGGGFIAIGGEDSYALGQYKDTALETILPVNMEMEGPKKIPDMSFVMVIDHSGSMGDGNQYITNLDLAKDAAIEALDTLRAEDDMGVIAFDSTFEWVVPLQKIADRNKIEEQILGITIQGGTSIYPALRAAIEAQIENASSLKHILLLTDGQDTFTEYTDLMVLLNEHNISLSTVAVGDGADTNLLQRLAANGNGRAYITNINTDMPRIFAQEIYLSVKGYLNNYPFTPIQQNSHSIFEGIGNGLPELLGYIGTSAKNSATVLMKSDTNDPILAVWQYGLGKTVAWTSDATGHWNGNYVDWEQNGQLWQNIIMWTISDFVDDNYASVRLEGNKGILEYSTNNLHENLIVKSVYTTENGERNELILKPSKPGIYEADIPMDIEGVYLINVREEIGGEVVGFYNTAAAMQYSKEYIYHTSHEALALFVTGVNGEFITDLRDIFNTKAHSVASRLDATDILVLLAILLFLSEIAMRRLNIRLPQFPNVKRKQVLKKEPLEMVQQPIKTVSVKEKRVKVPRKNVNKVETGMINTSALLKKKEERGP